jgi:hypothetical protein
MTNTLLPAQMFVVCCVYSNGIGDEDGHSLPPPPKPIP